MFSKVLVANRGEIACRIIRACHKLGVKAVAVYSEADSDALHVRLADEAHLIGPAPAAESYLNIPAIIEAAVKSKVDAVHPGYGFLAQSPAFARECLMAGLVFIGPTADVMERMGDKAQARRTAIQAGLPVLPGTTDAVTEDEAIYQARTIGYPLLVKGAASGGGIGMQVVSDEHELVEAIARARSITQKAFGNPRVYLEKFLAGASHIEVQVLGDWPGKVVHLYERDCSVQRRYQKIVEETPSVKITSEQRQLLAQYAVTLTRHIGYINAGTVEFLVSKEGNIYFLEMNTRLQVEHGITELVTGLDVVELQIRIASGQPIPFKQGDVKVHGHAIEARVYAEDPVTLLPQSGRIEQVAIPLEKNARVDTALVPSLEVTPYYDHLLAKVMAWGRNRKRAINKLSRYLGTFKVEGVSTNRQFLLQVLAHPAFQSGQYDTNLLSQFALVESPVPSQMLLATSGSQQEKEQAAAIAVSLALAEEGTASAPREATSAWRLFGRQSQMLSRPPSGRSWR